MEVWIVPREVCARYETSTTVDAVFSNQESAEAYCAKKTLQEGKWRHAARYDYELHYIED